MCTINAYLPILNRTHEIVLNNTPRIYQCDCGWSWCPPPLVDFDLWCVLSGQGVMRTDSAQFELFAGTCFVLPPGFQPDASHRPERPLSVFAVHFDVNGVGPAPTVPLWARVKDVAFLTALAERCQEAGAAGGEMYDTEAHVLESVMHISHICCE